MSKPYPYTLVDEYTDYRGNLLRAGDTVSYAALSGRSAQQVEAVILEIQNVTPEYGKPALRMKLLPTGRSSRWNQHWSAKDGEPRRAVLVSPEMVVAV